MLTVDRDKMLGVSTGGGKDYNLPDTFPKLSFKMWHFFIGSSVLW